MYFLYLVAGKKWNLLGSAIQKESHIRMSDVHVPVDMFRNLFNRHDIDKLWGGAPDSMLSQKAA